MDSSNLINIYTDGACSGNPGPGLPEQAPSVYILIRLLESIFTYTLNRLMKSKFIIVL